MSLSLWKLFAGLVVIGALSSCNLELRRPEKPVASPSAYPTTVPQAADSAEPQTVSVPPPAPGTIMRWLDDSELVFVPAGEFAMGDGDPDAPAHTVSLSSYWIHRTEVTNDQYALCLQLGQCAPPLDLLSEKRLTDPQLSDNPATGINWGQAQAYCGWMKGSLPTEAQWEKAARGPLGNTYPWGEAPPDQALLNFNDYLGSSSSVTAYPAGASHYGALDLAGNVFEWVGDWYDADYYQVSPPADPTGPGSGALRSVRSSGFNSGATEIAVALRSYSAPEVSRPDLGFRCVLSRPAPVAPYCQATGFARADPSRSGGNCSPTVTSNRFACISGDGFGTADIAGGRVTSVTVLAPADGSASCEIYRGFRIACLAFDPGAAIQARVCVECSDAAAAGVPPEFVCPAGMMPAGDPTSPTACIRRETGEESTCGEGLVPDPGSPGECIPNPCPPGRVYDPGDPMACAPDACPEGLVPDPRDPAACILNPCPEGFSLHGSSCLGEDLPCIDGTHRDADSGRCVPNPESVLPTMLCPEGTYYEPTLMLCISGDGVYSAGAECLAGMDFDGAGKCCRPPSGTSYPGCAPGEAHVLTEFGASMAPLVSCVPVGGGGESCATISVRTGECPKPDIPPSCDGLDKKDCDATPGCSWDDQSNTCS